MEDGFLDITPRPSLLRSQQHTNISNEEAIGDLIDNSLEQRVNATTVSIIKEPSRLIITDDGDGMGNLQDIESALKQGPGYPRSPTDLGRFGMGLKISSSNLGDKLTVLTRSADLPLYCAVIDIAEIENTKMFRIPGTEATPEMQELFSHYNKGTATGTMLIIEKSEGKITLPDEDLVEVVSQHISESHRWFLQQGKRILVNGKELTPSNPLAATYTTEEPQLFDQKYNFMRPNGNQFRLRIIFSLLPKPVERDPRNGLNMVNQGFYLMRNNRQVERGTWLGVVAKHPELNLIRAELHFSGDVDDVLGVNYQKVNVHPEAWFIKQLRANVKEMVSFLREKSVNPKQAQERLDAGQVDIKPPSIENVEQRVRKSKPNSKTVVPSVELTVKKRALPDSKGMVLLEDVSTNKVAAILNTSNSKFMERYEQNKRKFKPRMEKVLNELSGLFAEIVDNEENVSDENNQQQAEPEETTV